MMMKKVWENGSLCMLIILSFLALIINCFASSTTAPGIRNAASSSTMLQPTLTGTVVSELGSSIITQVTGHGRKLKANHQVSASHGDVNLEDYGPIDPSPSSKAVLPGPIQHGTPLNPFIPKQPPSPPPMPSRADDDQQPPSPRPYM